MKPCTAFFFAVFVIFAFLGFASCSSGSSSSAFIEQLDIADGFIAAEDYGGAWRLLKKNAKHAHTSWDYIGLIRRALLLSKNDFAEKQMRKALSLFPDNQELLAVYTHFLISSNRTDEARPYAVKLEGGKYGSLYAELRFRTAGAAGTESESTHFLSSAYTQAYIDAAATTGNSAYVRNAALTYALSGRMRDAFSLHPAAMSVYDMPEFWARLSYDSGNFIQCAEDLQFVQPSAEAAALSADAFLRSGDEQAAIKAWIHSIDRFPLANPASWYNAARAALHGGNMGYAYFFLSSLTRNFPDYIPGLSAYGKLSVYDAPQTGEHLFSAVLKEKGIKTLSMELDDVVPRADPREALLRMEKSLNRKKDAALALEHLKLQWMLSDLQTGTAAASGERQKAADIWRLLEKNIDAPYENDSLIIRFALWYFCNNNMIAEASELFNNWTAVRYNLESDAAGKKQDKEKNKKEDKEESGVVFKDAWEYEIAAYIAFRQEDYSLAEKILAAAQHNKNVAISPNALLNLALLYNGSSRRIQALALYKQILDTDIDKKLKAEIYYKIALIQREKKENRNAVLSLNQALSLDPAHSRSRLMLKQLDASAQ
ncbi:hypothetical protein H0R92_13765 [Treponema sp. OMZ 840]|uniref:hypothetical protein n=1 Tax=Treponema sp. OMZ 840 TaxID=244313 RepID=UPI003D8CE635